MDSDQSCRVKELNLDLAFTGFNSNKYTENLDEETKNTLTSFNTWSETLHDWIVFIRNDINLTCPEIVRTNNCISLGLIFTNDLYITQLNKEWRKKDVLTDVLSFPAIDGQSNLLLDEFVELGDIIISVETALNQSKFHKHSLSKELRWLASHGLLHLLGWDHQTQSMLDTMLTLQDRLLQLNVNSTVNKFI